MTLYTIMITERETLVMVVIIIKYLCATSLLIPFVGSHGLDFNFPRGCGD